MIKIDRKDYDKNMLDGCYYIAIFKEETPESVESPHVLRDRKMGHPLSKGTSPYYTNYLDWVLTIEDAVGHLNRNVYRFDSEKELDDYLNKLRMARELMK